METWTKMIMDSFDTITTLEKKLAAKQLEVTKRREVVETTLNTDLAKKKDEAKIELLDSKIVAKVASIDKTISYYETEIANAETRMKNEILRLEQKFESYRKHCQDAIAKENEKRSIVIGPIEMKKEILQQTSERSEDDDKVLVKLKVEEKQLAEQLEDAKKLKHSYELRQAECMTAMREQVMRENADALRTAQEEQRQRDLAYYNEQKAIVEQDTKERRERNRLRWEDEQREKEEKERRKEEKIQNLKRFKTTIFPHLTPDETVTYDRLYKESSELYQELLTLEDYPGVKDFLSMHKPDIDKIIEFEEREYPKLTQKEKDAYDNLADYDVKIKILRVKEKTKRREMLKKL